MEYIRAGARGKKQGQANFQSNCRQAGNFIHCQGKYGDATLVANKEPEMSRVFTTRDCRLLHVILKRAL